MALLLSARKRTFDEVEYGYYELEDGEIRFDNVQEVYASLPRDLQALVDVFRIPCAPNPSILLRQHYYKVVDSYNGKRVEPLGLLMPSLAYRRACFFDTPNMLGPTHLCGHKQQMQLQHMASPRSKSPCFFCRYGMRLRSTTSFFQPKK